MEVVMFSVLQEEVGSFAFQLGCDQKQFTNEIPAFFGFFFLLAHNCTQMQCDISVSEEQ